MRASKRLAYLLVLEEVGQVVDDHRLGQLGLQVECREVFAHLVVVGDVPSRDKGGRRSGIGENGMRS